MLKSPPRNKGWNFPVHRTLIVSPGLTFSIYTTLCTLAIFYIPKLRSQVRIWGSQTWAPGQGITAPTLELKPRISDLQSLQYLDSGLGSNFAALRTVWRLWYISRPIPLSRIIAQERDFATNGRFQSSPRSPAWPVRCSTRPTVLHSGTWGWRLCPGRQFYENAQ